MINDDDDDNKEIYIAPLGRNFWGAGFGQRISEQRKVRKPGKCEAFTQSIILEQF